MTRHIDGIHKELLSLLKGGNAHASFDDVVAYFPAAKRGIIPEGLPYSAWQLLEHIRIAQRDILRFSTNYDGNYESPKWPEGYWPKSPAPPDDKAWDDSIQKIKADRLEFENLLKDPKHDMVEPFSWGEGQNLLRETLLIADHESHHLGELIAVRRLLHIWPVKK